MVQIGGTALTSFKIWEVPEETDRKTLSQSSSAFDRWKMPVNGNQNSRSAEKPVQTMRKFSRRSKSKDDRVSEIPTKTPENEKLPSDVPNAPVKRIIAKNFRVDSVPRRLDYTEVEAENGDSLDSGVGHTQDTQINRRYPTRLRLSSQTTQNENFARSKNPKSKSTKSKSKKILSDFGKENDGNGGDRSQPQQSTSSNTKRLSRVTINLPDSQNLATPEELSTNETRLSLCLSDDPKEHIRWLQARREVSLWVECCKKNCRKWRYCEEYHDPLDVPTLWYCNMNSDARFANCSIPEQSISSAEAEQHIMNAYNAGSIVWARINGYPWWPAMVDDCPDLLQYYVLREPSIVPYQYHVTFFSENKVERAWMPLKDIKPYVSNPRESFIKKTEFRGIEYSRQLDGACALASQALPLSIYDRLKKFSYLSLTSGSIGDAAEQRRKRERIVVSDEDRPTKKTISVAGTSSRKKEASKKDRMINIGSRIINVDKDTVVNIEASTSKNSSYQRLFETDSNSSTIKRQPQLSSRRSTNISSTRSNALFDDYDSDDSRMSIDEIVNTCASMSFLGSPKVNEQANETRANIVSTDVDDGGVSKPSWETLSTLELIDSMSIYAKSMDDKPTRLESSSKASIRPSGIGNRSASKLPLEPLSSQNLVNSTFKHRRSNINKATRCQSIVKDEPMECSSSFRWNFSAGSNADHERSFATDHQVAGTSRGSFAGNVSPENVVPSYIDDENISKPPWGTLSTLELMDSMSIYGERMDDKPRRSESSSLASIRSSDIDNKRSSKFPLQPMPSQDFAKSNVASESNFVRERSFTTDHQVAGTSRSAFTRDISPVSIVSSDSANGKEANSPSKLFLSLNVMHWTSTHRRSNSNTSACSQHIAEHESIKHSPSSPASIASVLNDNPVASQRDAFNYSPIGFTAEEFDPRPGRNPGSRESSVSFYLSESTHFSQSSAASDKSERSFDNFHVNLQSQRNSQLSNPALSSSSLDLSPLISQRALNFLDSSGSSEIQWQDSHRLNF